MVTIQTRQLFRSDIIFEIDNLMSKKMAIRNGKIIFFQNEFLFQGSRQSLGQMSGVSDCPEKYRDIAL